MGTKTARHRYSLKGFIYRVLIRRLVATGAVIAFVVALLAYFILSARLEEQIINTAHERIVIMMTYGRMIAKDQHLSPIDGFLRAIGEFPAQSATHRTGHMIYGRIYDRQGKPIIDWSSPIDPPPAGVKARVISTPKHYPPANGSWKESFRDRGSWYLHFVVPITGMDGSVLAYSGVLYAIAPEPVQRLRRSLILNIAVVTCIVLVTTILLYPVILHLLHRLIAFSDDLLDANLGELTLLGSAVAKRDSDTDAHNYRVTLYAVRLAEMMRLDKAQMQSLIKGAFLHDVGKIGIRDDILLKPGRLDNAEFSIMQTHVRHGAEIISQSPWLQDSLAVVSCHHERFDGNGYPTGLKGEAIPVVARIFAIADVFDALTSLRPYKSALPLEEALEIMRQNRGTHFDSHMFDVFATMAPDLYASIRRHTLDDLRRELDSVVHRYFPSGSDAMPY